MTGISALLATIAGYRVYWGDWSAMARVGRDGLHHQLFGWYPAFIPLIVTLAMVGLTMAARRTIARGNIIAKLSEIQKSPVFQFRYKSQSESNETVRIAGHHSDFDELAWYQTYRAVAAAQDEILPQSEAEARFVEQMLGNEPIRVHTPVPLRRAVKPWQIVVVFAIGLCFIVIVMQTDRKPVNDAAPVTPATTAPTLEPSTTLGPNHSLAPYDRRAVDVIAEMLAIAAEANPTFTKNNYPQIVVDVAKQGQEQSCQPFPLRG